MRRRVLLVACCSVLPLAPGCGGGSPSAPSAATPPSGSPTPTAPPAAPTPTPNPFCGGNQCPSDLAPGPVASVRIKVRTIQGPTGEYRDIGQEDGAWIVYKGDFVVFDLDQLNTSGQKCIWIKDPTWSVDDPERIVSLRGSSQPFLLRTDMVGEGRFAVTGMIDGFVSAPLTVESRKKS